MKLFSLFAAPSYSFLPEHNSARDIHSFWFCMICRFVYNASAGRLIPTLGCTNFEKFNHQTQRSNFPKWQGQMSTFPKVHSAPAPSCSSPLQLRLRLTLAVELWIWASLPETNTRISPDLQSHSFRRSFEIHRILLRSFLFQSVQWCECFSVINNQVAYLKHLAQFLFELYWADVCMYQ